jgi:hypothetical protein
MAYERPSFEAMGEAIKHFDMAKNYMEYLQRDEDWYRAVGYLQDGLAELGFDLVPLKQQPTATADAIFDDAAFNYGRGGV